jgi:tetratricopeptide (TPR) repeat protein
MHCRVFAYSVRIILLHLAFMAPVEALDIDSISNDGLKFCISYYRDGYYNRTIECINHILPNLTHGHDSLQAYKYLALSYGMTNQIDKAESCFRQAIERNPKMEIDTLEFPPNIALIYNHVRLEKKVERLNATKANPPPVPVQIAPPVKKSTGLPTIMLTGAILSAAGAGFLFFKGLESRHDYNLEHEQAKIDKAWNSFIYSVTGGGICTLACGVFTWMFFTLDGGDSGTAMVAPQLGGIVLSLGF